MAALITRSEGMWPADLHLVGKDIIRFHTVYWPAFLMAAMLPIPKQVWAHGWFLMDATKMSKSKGNVVLPRPIVNMLGMDALRYFLLREVVFGQDGNFSYDALVTRYNSDLANGLGNLASRTAAMIERYFGGIVPAVSTSASQKWQVAQVASTVKTKIIEDIERFNFSGALQGIWELIATLDQFIAEAKPWKLADSTDPDSRENLKLVLWTSAQALRYLSVLCSPFVPKAAQQLWVLFGQTGNVADQSLDNLNWGMLDSGIKLGQAITLFPRVDKSEAIERIEAMTNEELNPTAPPAPAAAPTSTSAADTASAPVGIAQIGIDDFIKVEMRVGQVKTAERIMGADKLLKLTVDIGTEVRQICAGIAQFYEPDSLVGRKVVVVTNLAPRKLRGVESNGMIVAASVGPEGRPVLAGFSEDVEVGARLK